MSVLVKGMKMPTHCTECDFWHDGVFEHCLLNIEVQNEDVPFNEGEYPEGCPLIEIPPHGRLIDAAEISEHKYTTIPSYRKKYADGKPKSDEEIIAFKFGWNYAIDEIVENAPTIIPASDKDTNVLGKEEGET